jgi:DNA-binding MarR family transcriptional regulator
VAKTDVDHPVLALDDLVHQRVRLGILTVTFETDRAEFGFIKELLDLTGGNLSQHLSALEIAGLISIEKGYEGKRARTWISITKFGKQALKAEIAQLKRLVRQMEAIESRNKRN